MSKMLGPAYPRFTGFKEFFKDESVVLKSWVTAFLGASEYFATSWFLLLKRLYDPFLLKFFPVTTWSFNPIIAGVEGNDFLLIDFSLFCNLNLELELVISDGFSFCIISEFLSAVLPVLW